MDRYHLRLTFTEGLLGTISLDPEIYEKYIASRIGADGDSSDELYTVEEATEKGTTGFHKIDGQPLIYDYVLKGFMKDACSMLKRAPGTHSSKQTAFKKIIDGLVFVKPRHLLLHMDSPVEMIDRPACERGSVLVRPLRAQTAQGERVTLARSERAPAGTWLECELHILGGVDEALLREWLDYGCLRGLGQWRNGGYGTFTYELKKL